MVGMAGVSLSGWGVLAAAAHDRRMDAARKAAG